MSERADRSPLGAHERTLIREAMDRLIEGRALFSDGKLTTKSLAAEARVDRSVLYQKYPDLREEFSARITRRGETATALARLEAKERASRERSREIAARLEEAEETIRRYARIVQVLGVENEALRARPAADAKSKVRHLRPVDGEDR